MENCPLNGTPCPNSKSYQILVSDGGEFVQKMVCEKCAYLQYKKNSVEALEELMGIIENITDKYQKDIKKCSQCNCCFEDIVKKSRLGCDMCYESFRDKILAMITKCQVGYKHIGKRPKKHDTTGFYLNTEDEIVILQSKMQLAISEENYELANELKQKIDKLKNKKAQNEI
jgi:protein arginine kinase activator